MCDERPGAIFHGQFNQTTTRTHRLSSSGRPQQFTHWKNPKSVQFQNMPREFKGLFRSRDPGYAYIATDAAQLEFRVAVYLGQDKQGMRDVRDPKFDAHIYTASVLYERDYAELFEAAKVRGDKAAKQLRQDAKPQTYKPLYGGEKGSPAEERYYAAFRERYYELNAVQEGWLNEVLEKNRLETSWGLRFYWDWFFKQMGRESVALDRRTFKPIKASVYNYPVQSLATAEIVPIAFISLYHRAKRGGLDVRFVNMVHDDIVAEVKLEHVEKYREAVRPAFTYDVYEYLERIYGLEFTSRSGTR